MCELLYLGICTDLPFALLYNLRFTIFLLQANATFGTCDVPVLSPPPPAGNATFASNVPGTRTGTAQEPGSNSPVTRHLQPYWFIFIALTCLMPL